MFTEAESILATLALMLPSKLNDLHGCFRFAPGDGSIEAGGMHCTKTEILLLWLCRRIRATEQTCTNTTGTVVYWR